MIPFVKALGLAALIVNLAWMVIAYVGQRRRARHERILAVINGEGM